MSDFFKFFSHARAAPGGTAAAEDRAPEPPAARQEPSTSTAAPDSHLGRLSNALSRTGARFKSNKFDVSTAVYQRSSLGKPFAPEDYVANGARYERDPRAPAVPHTAATPLHRTDKSALDALSRFSRSQSQPKSRPQQPHHDTIPLEAIATEATAMDSDAALRTHVNATFPAPAGNLLLGAELSHRLAALGAPEGSPPTTRGALIAHAMKTAHIGDAQEASQALDRLAHLDFGALDQSRSTSAADAHAWRIARTLSNTDAGFEALEHFRRDTQPPADADTRAAQRMMLEAADALDTSTSNATGPALDPAPGAVADRHTPATATPLADTPLAWRAYASASTMATHGRRALTADQKGAYFAWQQHFRDDSPGSELSRTRERLNKFSSKTIGNVTAPRWKTFFPRLAGKRKSPLSALQIGVQGVPRKQVGAEVAALQQAMRDALPDLRDSPAMQPQAALAHARPEQSIAELAAMQVWLESGGFPAGTVDTAHVGRIAERARELCADLRPDQVSSPAVLDHMKMQTQRWANADPAALLQASPFKSMAGQPFNLERLASWGKVAHVPADSPFWTKVDELKNARPEPATTPARSVEAARESLHDVASHLQGGSRLRLTDGSRVGVSTRGASANIGKLLHLHGIPLAPRIDLRKSRAREAVVELSMSTHGTEMFLGTAKTDQQHAALGVLVGYDVDVGLTRMRAGVTTQAVLHSEELVSPSGVTLRVARRVKEDGSGYDDAPMRETMAGLVDHVFDESTHAHVGGSRATWNRLAEYCLEHPDVSVSWTDTISREVKRGGSADASATFQPTRAITEARFGPNVGIGYEKLAQQTLDSSEHSGRVQIEQHRAGGGLRWLARLSGGLSTSTSVGTGDRSAGIGLASIDAPSLTVPIRDSTHLAKVQLVRENGALNHRACLFDTEYSSARHYTHAIDASREQWIDLFAAQTLDEQAKERAHAAQTGAPAPQQPDAREVAAHRLDRHLGDVKANRRMNQRFFHRYRLTRTAAKKIDVLSAMRDPSSHPSIDKKVDQVLSDPASWMPIELKVKERTSAKPSTGLNVALQLSTQTSATGDRELFAEGIPFALLERLDP